MPFSEFSEELTEKFRLVEVQRQQYKKELKTLIIIFVSIAAVCLIIGLMVANNPMFVFVPIIILAIIYFFLASSNKKKMANLFKQKILVPAIELGFPEMKYRSKPGISESDFLKSTLYSRSDVDRYESEDLFKGNHGDTHFWFCEAHAERKETTTDSKGNSSTKYVTIFQGIFMIADFNKKLQYTTRIFEARDNFFERLFNRKSKVSLEHPEFEHIFNTYSEDQVEARYILSPAMMERIIKLKKSWQDKINLSFRGNHIFIAINHSENLFEPDVDKNIDIKQVKRIFDEIEGCLNIIDTLDLNTRIWTKE